MEEDMKENQLAVSDEDEKMDVDQISEDAVDPDLVE